MARFAEHPNKLKESLATHDIFNLAATGTAGFPEGRGKVWPAAPNLIGGVTASQSAEAGHGWRGQLPAFGVRRSRLVTQRGQSLVLHVCRPVIHLNDLAGHDGTRREHSGLVQVLVPDRVYRAVVNARHDVGVNDRLHASDVHDVVDVPYVLGVLDVVISGDVMHLRHGIVSVAYHSSEPVMQHVIIWDGLPYITDPCRKALSVLAVMLGLVKGLSPVANGGCTFPLVESRRTWSPSQRDHVHHWCRRTCPGTVTFPSVAHGVEL